MGGKEREDGYCFKRKMLCWATAALSKSVRFIISHSEPHGAAKRLSQALFWGQLTVSNLLGRRTITDTQDGIVLATPQRN